MSRMGCTTFTTDARKVLLSQFGFRINERFLYEYDFGDLWQHQIRFEGIQPIRGKKIYPVCVGGACASPPEDCGGPEAYMEKMDHHRWNPPLDELQLIADARRYRWRSGMAERDNEGFRARLSHRLLDCRG